MEQPGQPPPDADRQHHVAQLADGGVGEHPLDVVGDQRDRGGDEQGDRSDVRDDQERIGREDGIEPPYEIDASGHHRRRMDER